MPSLSPDDEVAVMATGGSSKGLPLVTEMKNLLQRKLRSNLTGVGNTRVLPVGADGGYIVIYTIVTAAGRKHLLSLSKYIQRRRPR